MRSLNAPFKICRSPFENFVSRSNVTNSIEFIVLANDSFKRVQTKMKRSY